MYEPFSPPENIGFIGLGKMGEPMVRNLAKAGFRPVLFDLNRDIVAKLAKELRAKAPASLPELARVCRVVITMVPDGAIVREIVLGGRVDAGASLSAGMTAGSVLIDMSSSSPTSTRELGKELAKRGLLVIDAPVSGGVRRAVSGELAIMVGGDGDVIDRCRPILASMGSKIFVAGPLGAGHAIKALNNYVSAAGYLAASEALVAGARFGLDPQVMLDIFNASSGMNNSTQNKFSQYVLSRRFDAGFSMGLMAKDLRTALEVLRATDTPAPLADYCVPFWEDAAKKLGPHSDHTEMVRVLEQATGTELKKGGSS